MGKNDEFKHSFNKAADAVRKLDLNKPFRIIGNYDSDGLSAAAILVKALKREGIKFCVSIIRQLNKDIVNELSKEDYSQYIFSDLGSSNVNMLDKALSDRFVLILDHHKPESIESKCLQINPHLHGVDGSKDISASGVAYMFAKALNMENVDLAHIALIGAIGDVQEDKGFNELNNEILEDAISSGKIEVKQGLRFFGMQTKPLHKVLEYSTDPFIPGVSGSEHGAFAFLNELGINPKEGNKWKKLVHLETEDLRKLVTGIVMRRIRSEKNPDDVLGPIYLLKEEDEESPTKDAKEFSTLLNACGRLNRPSLGIGSCLGNKSIRDKAIELLGEYRRQIINALDWFYKNKDKCIEGEGFVIINAADKVNDALIGTMASIISRSNLYIDGTVVMTMARTIDDKTKISIRKAGYKSDSKINLLEIIRIASEKTGGEFGGHAYNAAGAIISQDKEEEFIKEAIIAMVSAIHEAKMDEGLAKALNNLSLEETLTKDISQ